MKINELVTMMSNNKNKLLKAEQLQALLVKELEVKDYLSIKRKREIVEDIVNACIVYDEGVFKFDDIDKYVCFTMRTIAAYTNLELSNDMEDDYDLLCQSKLLDMVINTFKKEYDEINVLLQMKCDYMLSSNSIEAQFGRFLDGVSDKLDGLNAMIASKFNNFDISKLPFSGQDLQKLMKFIDMQK